MNAPPPAIDEKLAARLIEHGWDVTETGCWEWRSHREKAGYGKITVEGRTNRAHRVAHRAWVGPIPDGMLVRHVVCDNPPCINPEHLTVGTHQDNANDRVAHGRTSASDPTCRRGHAWTPENTLQTKTQRHCRTCRREAASAWKKTEKGRATRNAQQRRRYHEKKAA